MASNLTINNNTSMPQDLHQNFRINTANSDAMNFEIENDSFTLSEVKEENKKDKKDKTKIWAIISGSIFGTVLLSAELIHIFKRGATKTKLDNLSDELQKIDKNKRFAGFIEKAKAKILPPFVDAGKKIMSFLDPLLNNPVSARDTFLEYCSKKLHTTKVTEGLKIAFRDLAISSINSKYQKLDHKVFKTCEKLRNDVNQLEISPNEKKDILNLIQQAKDSYTKNFNHNARNSRFIDVWNSYEKVGDEVTEFWKNDLWCKTKDKRQALKSYVSFNLPNIKTQTEKNIKIVSEPIKELLGTLNQINNKIIKISDQKEKQKLLKLSKSLETKLSSVSNMETKDLYEKFIELRVGSATSDVLFYMFPLGFLIWALATSKDKRELMSNTLTQGIPLAGGLGVTFWSVARLDNSFKSLIIGMIAGEILNILGSAVDKGANKIYDKIELNKKALEYYMQNNSQTETDEQANNENKLNITS